MKRLSGDTLKEHIEAKQKDPAYKGAMSENVVWDSLRYDETSRRQIIDINTVDADNKPDGNKRSIATSDLHHTRYTEDLAKSLQRKRTKKNKKVKAD
jgi:ethanolamine utilization protein EutQ (cupin superfamily)